MGPVERRLPSLPRRSYQNRAPGVSAMIVIRKPIRTSTTCQPEPPRRLKMPRWSSQLHDAVGAALLGSSLLESSLLGSSRLRFPRRQLRRQGPS